MGREDLLTGDDVGLMWNEGLCDFVTRGMRVGGGGGEGGGCEDDVRLPVTRSCHWLHFERPFLCLS